MILEGLVTTTDPAGGMHLAAMGPTVDDAERLAGRIERLVLRPFPTSQTAANLVRSRAGVFHVTDDVLVLAQIVAGALPGPPPARPATAVAGFVLADACRAWEFAVDSVDDSAQRLRLEARVVAEHAGRPFLGFSRAAHAVVEAAILVTRLHIADAADVARQFRELAVLVEKTGGPRDREAFDLLAGRVARGPTVGIG
ncbi:MAG: DUF447 domain-containing protein [Planctomycetota bacterium]